MILLKHISLAKKFVNELNIYLEKEKTELIKSDLNDIDIFINNKIINMRKNNSKNFLSKLEKHFHYQSITDKSNIIEPEYFNNEDILGFEDSSFYIKDVSKKNVDMISLLEYVDEKEKLCEDIRIFINKKYILGS